jgi:hypothetical protein
MQAIADFDYLGQENINYISTGGNICNNLIIGLEGQTDMNPLKELDIDINNFDGYRVTYQYFLMDELKVSDVQMIVFGFHEDIYGYFGLGVLGDREIENKYASHGVGYANWYDGMTWDEIKEELT